MRRQLEAHGETPIRGQRGSLRACNRKPVNCGTFVVAPSDFHTSQPFVTYVLVPCAVGVFRWSVSGVKASMANRAIRRESRYLWAFRAMAVSLRPVTPDTCPCA
jgi:hypothetical protein